jgi:hypothetical protein
LLVGLATSREEQPRKAATKLNKAIAKIHARTSIDFIADIGLIRRIEWVEGLDSGYPPAVRRSIDVQYSVPELGC